MKEYNMYCDHCGKKLNTQHDFDDLTIEINHKWTVADLCSECLDKLYDIVCDFCNKKGGDVVEVVRCKDCKFSNNSYCAGDFTWCEKFDLPETEDDFCSHGERSKTK